MQSHSKVLSVKASTYEQSSVHTARNQLSTISTHILLARTSHMALTDCKRGWKASSSHMPKKERRPWCESALATSTSQE